MSGPNLRLLKILFLVLTLVLPNGLLGADAVTQINAIFNTHMSYPGGISAFTTEAPALSAPTDIATLTTLWNAINAAAKATPTADATQLSNTQQAFWNGIILPATVLPPFDATIAEYVALYTAVYNACKSLCQPSCSLITGPVSDSSTDGTGSMQYQLDSFITSLDLPASITSLAPATAPSPISEPRTPAPSKPATKKTVKKLQKTIRKPANAPVPSSEKTIAPTHKHAKQAPKVIKAVVANPKSMKK